MPTRESPLSHELAELRAWYVDGLQPKLARAAESGAVEPVAAAVLDLRVRELLGLRGTHAVEAG